MKSPRTLQKTDPQLQFLATPAMALRSTGLRMEKLRNQFSKTWNPGRMPGRKVDALGSTLTKKLSKRSLFPSSVGSKITRLVMRIETLF